LIASHAAGHAGPVTVAPAASLHNAPFELQFTFEPEAVAGERAVIVPLLIANHAGRVSLF
jgi:hypothetical protein